MGRPNRNRARFLWVVLLLGAFATDISADDRPELREPSAVDPRVERALAIDGVLTEDPECAGDAASRIRCRIAKRYERDPAAATAARTLFDRYRIVAGVERASRMDGGYRGLIELVPAWPVGRRSRMLTWVLDAHERIERVLASTRAIATRPVAYEHRGITYRFVRSVGRRTPSAYASDWTIGFNVEGSLHRNRDAVANTLVHEILHLNDESDRFTATALRAIHTRILERCAGSSRCLATFAPTRVRVRGGTYYSFQPDNGDAVVEYGAELASRWFEEHERIARDGRLRTTPFRCLAPENAEAYRLIADRFFGGVDRTPPCR